MDLRLGCGDSPVRAFATAIDRRTEAVVPVIDSMFFNARDRLAKLAIAHRLPTMAANLDMVDAGALMAFGPNHATLFRQSAKLADRILRGQRAGDIPVEQPTHFELRVNLKTAKPIGIDLPKPSSLGRIRLSSRRSSRRKRDRHERNAATTASPISSVPTRRIPGSKMSAVR